MIAKTDFPQGQSDRPDFSWKIKEQEELINTLYKLLQSRNQTQPKEESKK